jgi:plasmid replication initiation protein
MTNTAEALEIEVIKNRNIIQSHHHLTLGEHRLVTSCVQVINDRTSENRPIKIRVEDFAKAWNVSRSTAHVQLQGACDKMWQREIKLGLSGASKGMETLRWLQRKIILDSGEVEIHFSDKIYKVIHSISSDESVPILLSTITKFNCQHTHRIYDNMKAKNPDGRDTWRWETSVAEFRDILDLKDKYTIWGELRRSVINVVCDEITKHTEMSLTWRITSKVSRAVDRIEFSGELKPDEKYLTKDNLPKLATRIDPNFAPTDKTLQTLLSDGMSMEFIEREIPRFVIFFEEEGSSHKSWQAKFIRHCDMYWRNTAAGKQSELFTPSQAGKPARGGKTAKAGSRTLTEDGEDVGSPRGLEALGKRFTDRSWAE